MSDIESKIKSLEEKLLHSDVKKNPEIINELLSDDFVELANNGKLTSRDDVVHWLGSRDLACRWKLTEFSTRQILPELILAIYKADKIIDDGVANKRHVPAGSVRSSLWKKTDGSWKMVFHQATKIENASFKTTKD